MEEVCVNVEKGKNFNVKLMYSSAARDFQVDGFHITALGDCIIALHESRAALVHSGRVRVFIFMNNLGGHQTITFSHTHYFNFFAHRKSCVVVD